MCLEAQGILETIPHSLYTKFVKNLVNVWRCLLPVGASFQCVCRISNADTPQFRGGNPYLFSENPYQSVSFIYASMYRENVHAIHITMQFLQKKSRHCVIQIDIQQQKKQNRSFTSRGATDGLGLRL